MKATKGRVLVIEDHEPNQRLANQILTMHGYEVVVAATAELGLSLAQSDIDIILMDIQLPGMDGFEATRALKADPATAAIPVVAVTALSRAADVHAAHAAGCCAVVTKPYSIRQLVGAVATTLAKRLVAVDP